MKKFIALPLLLWLVAGCDDDKPAVSVAAKSAPPSRPSPRPAAPAPPVATKEPTTLAEARRGFVTKAADRRGAAEPVANPPTRVFGLIRFESPVGKLAAYLTPDPGDRKRHPAVIWITGGDCNSIGDMWKPAPRENDQTAAAYRKAGIVLMFPSLRGGNDNPGRPEGCFGEVDDVLAAARHLASLDYVDPDRIYLGGHSTGGTLAMLVAECSDRFRAVFAFGPADGVLGYPPEYLPFNTSDPTEILLRSPGRWLPSVRSPLFVFEGTNQPANIDSLRAMALASQNPLIRFLPVPGADHFSILAPLNDRIAAKILRDEGKTTNIAFSPEELKPDRR